MQIAEVHPTSAPEGSHLPEFFVLLGTACQPEVQVILCFTEIGNGRSSSGRTAPGPYKNQQNR
jgi:hypothetical protein